MSITENFIYFDRSVLNFYRTNSHVYKLIEDDMGGTITMTSSRREEDKERFPTIHLKFAFRELMDGRVSVGVFVPSFRKDISEDDYQKWIAFLIKEPQFLEESTGFKRWVDRYLNGDWDVEDGPRVKIEKELKLINALTRISFKKNLFKYDEYRLLNYPISENTEEYSKSILEFYRLIIDGMEKEAIIKLADFLSIQLSDNSKRLNSLKEILPYRLVDKIFKPIKKLYDERMVIHGIPSKEIEGIPAFNSFHIVLVSMLSALIKLREWLESELNLEAESCLDRIGSMNCFFTELKQTQVTNGTLREVEKMIGKKIAKVEFGETRLHERVHKGEALYIHFEDGASVSIKIGSNAINLSEDYEGMMPSDMHTDLMVFWAESINKKNKD